MKKKMFAIAVLTLLGLLTFSTQTLGSSFVFSKAYIFCPWGPKGIECVPGTSFCAPRECIEY